MGATSIFQPSAIEIAPIVTGSTCLGADGSISVSVTGGTPGYLYAWSSGGSTSILSRWLGSDSTGAGVARVRPASVYRPRRRTLLAFLRSARSTIHGQTVCSGSHQSRLITFSVMNPHTRCFPAKCRPWTRSTSCSLSSWRRFRASEAIKCTFAE